MKESKFSIRKRLESFIYAWAGMKHLFRQEHNARIHLFFAILAIIGGIIFSISFFEWMMVLFSIALVFILEIINTCFENLSDLITKEKNEDLRLIKDMAAAAVLIAAITALLVAALIFIPNIVTSLWRNL